MVRMLDDAIHDWVAEMHVGGSHVDFCAQHHCAFFKFSGIHALEQIEVFLYRTIAKRTFDTGLGRSSFLFGNLFGCLFVDVCFAFFDHANGKLVKLWEIVGSIVFSVAPIVTKPFDVFPYGIHVFDVFFDGIGVVEAEIARAAKFFGNAKIHANSFGMANMQVSIRFRRETRVEPSSILAIFKIVGNDLFYKIQTTFFFF